MTPSIRVNLIQEPGPPVHLLAACEGRLAQLAGTDVALWDVATWKPAERLGTSRGAAMGWLKAGRLVALDDSGQMVRLLRPGSPSEPHKAIVSAVERGRATFADPEDPERFLWTVLRGGKELARVDTVPESGFLFAHRRIALGALDIGDLLALEDGSLVALRAGVLYRVDLRKGEVTPTDTGLRELADRLAPGPAGNQVWAGLFRTGEVRLLDLARPQTPLRVVSAPTHVWAVAARGDRLAVLSLQQPPIRWTLSVFKADGTPVWQTSVDHGNQANDLHAPYHSLLVGSAWVAAAGATGRMVVHDLESGRVLLPPTAQ